MGKRKKNLKKREYLFKKDWTNSNSKDYRAWVAESALGNKYFRCKESSKVPSIWGKKAHHLSERHVISIENNQKNLTIIPKSFNLDINVKKFEFKYIEFIIKNNISFTVAEKFIDFLKQFGDLSLVEKTKLSNTKISDIITEAAKPFMFED